MPKALPVRRWQAWQWHIEIRTGSPSAATRSWPQLQAASRVTMAGSLLAGVRHVAMRPAQAGAHPLDGLVQPAQLAFEVGQTPVAARGRPASRLLALAVAAQHLELGADEEALPAGLEQLRLLVGVYGSIIAERRPGFPWPAFALSMGGTNAVSDTRVCPYCHQ